MSLLDRKFQWSSLSSQTSVGIQLCMQQHETGYDPSRGTDHRHAGEAPRLPLGRASCWTLSSVCVWANGVLDFGDGFRVLNPMGSSLKSSVASLTYRA